MIRFSLCTLCLCGEIIFIKIHHHDSYMLSHLN
jgi:hypothetical protein